MEKRENEGKTETFEALAQIDELTSQQKISLIEETIIPKMNIRGGRKDNLKSLEIHEKLCRPPCSGKPGEDFELFSELIMSADGINGKIASELADVVYYGLQPNALESDRFDSNEFKAVLTGLCGIPIDAMLAFCLIKYSIRLDDGDKSNYKEIENTALNRYLTLHPELTNLWTVKENETTYQKEDIWDHVS